MTKYISKPENLKLMMNLLRDKSRNIQFEAFHVFKVRLKKPMIKQTTKEPHQKWFRWVNYLVEPKWSMSAKWLNKERADVCLYYHPSVQVTVFALPENCLEST